MIRFGKRPRAFPSARQTSIVPRVSAATRILLALGCGLLLGILSARSEFAASGIAIAEPVGALWLDALRMTIVPLLVSLLITGIAASLEAARAGRLMMRAVLLFLVILWLSAALGAMLLPAFLAIWPLPAASAEALRAALGTSVQSQAAVPGAAEFLAGMIPSNPVAAAANDAILPLVVFTVIFAFALTRLPAEQRALLTGFFGAVRDAMLVVIRWVLWIGPVGVLALAFVVGARAGTGAVGAIAHYVVAVSSVGVLIWLLAYPLARFGGGVSFRSFARAAAPAQAVAVSTQSSLASLPAMLSGADRLGIPPASSGVVLPLAVAVFRATSPAMNVAVALYIAHWLAIPLSPWNVAAGVATAAILTLGSMSLPGQVSFVTSIAPIAMAMGVPIAPLALLVAVEALPDIVRTVGNVSMDLAVTATATRSGARIAEPESSAATTGSG
jgi:Na+/H+-dicarboxylate symporter